MCQRLGRREGGVQNINICNWAAILYLSALADMLECWGGSSLFQHTVNSWLSKSWHTHYILYELTVYSSVVSLSSVCCTVKEPVVGCSVNGALMPPMLTSRYTTSPLLPLSSSSAVTWKISVPSPTFCTQRIENIHLWASTTSPIVTWLCVCQSSWTSQYFTYFWYAERCYKIGEKWSIVIHIQHVDN